MSFSFVRISLLFLCVCSLKLFCYGFVRSGDAKQMLHLVFWTPGAGEQRCPEPEHLFLTVTEPTPALKVVMGDVVIIVRFSVL